MNVFIFYNCRPRINIMTLIILAQALVRAGRVIMIYERERKPTDLGQLDIKRQRRRLDFRDRTRKMRRYVFYDDNKIHNYNTYIEVSRYICV